MEVKAVYIVLDEITNACGCCVLAILLQPVGKPPLAADLVFHEKVNFTTVSQAVIATLNTTKINFKYMNKDFNTVPQGPFPNAKHITCLAHLLTLVLEVFPDTFKGINQVCSMVKKVFCKAPQHHRELLAYMQALCLAPIMPVFAVLTRWASWIDAVPHLKEKLDILHNFILTLPLSSKVVQDL